MKLVIDTNLLFSAVIKPDGKIAEIILNPKFDLQIIGCYFSHIELTTGLRKKGYKNIISTKELLEIIAPKG